MDAQALTCPQCGAAAESDATACTFCRARLATVPCSACFGLVFIGSRHCGHCGVELAAPDLVAASAHPCPRGCGALRAIQLRGVDLAECQLCAGLWLRRGTFRRLYDEEESGAEALGPALIKHAVQRVDMETVRYVSCPECGKVMNRINFAKRSGVVLDSCAAHGTWFDADELRRVVEFVRSGNVDQIRKRERMYRADERKLLDLKRGITDPATGAAGGGGTGAGVRNSALESMLLLLGDF